MDTTFPPLPDLDGFVLPSLNATGPLQLRARHIQERYRYSLDRATGLACTELKNCSPAMIRACWAPALIHYSQRVLSERSSADQFNLQQRCFLLHPAAEEKTVVLASPAAVASTGLLLPHFNVRIPPPQLPFVLELHPGDCLIYLGGNGQRITLPLGDPTQFTVPGCASGGGSVGPLRVLNDQFDDRELGIAGVSPAERMSAPLILHQGLQYLRRIWPAAYASVRRQYDSVRLLPLPSGYTSSFTDGRLPGTFFASAHNPLQIGDALVHEVSHTRLTYLWYTDSLVEDGGAAVHFSPWRKDKRPLSGLINGVHAFLNVVGYYLRVLAGDPTVDPAPIDAIITTQTKRIRITWDYLLKTAVPTPTGQLLFDELNAAVDALP